MEIVRLGEAAEMDSGSGGTGVKRNPRGMIGTCRGSKKDGREKRNHACTAVPITFLVGNTAAAGSRTEGLGEGG